MVEESARKPHFGILAHSAEGAALCFLSFCREGFAEIGPHEHPDVSLDCIAMARSMAAWEAGDHETIRAILGLSIEPLARGGATFFACPDNTAHIALELPGRPFAIPGLDIADIVAEDAKQRGMRRVGILGTKYLMEGPLYPRAMSAQGIEPVLPDPAQRAEINRIIFDELVLSRFLDTSRDALVAIIGSLAARGCDGVALVCTEIPLLVGADHSPLPILDSTRLLARAAFEVAQGTRPRPTWRGGPVA